MKKDELKKLTYEINQLLEAFNKTEWKKTFTYFINELNAIESDAEIKSLAREILSIYKGMGSFNDLVLQREDRMPVYENERLDNLRKTLFDLAVNTITK